MLPRPAGHAAAALACPLPPISLSACKILIHAVTSNSSWMLKVWAVRLWGHVAKLKACISQSVLVFVAWRSVAAWWDIFSYLLDMPLSQKNVLVVHTMGIQGLQELSACSPRPACCGGGLFVAVVSPLPRTSVADMPPEQAQTAWSPPQWGLAFESAQADVLEAAFWHARNHSHQSTAAVLSAGAKEDRDSVVAVPNRRASGRDTGRRARSVSAIDDLVPPRPGLAVRSPLSLFRRRRSGARPARFQAVLPRSTIAGEHVTQPRPC